MRGLVLCCIAGLAACAMPEEPQLVCQPVVWQSGDYDQATDSLCLAVSWDETLPTIQTEDGR